VFGAAVADRLAGEGFDVTLIDRAEPGHGGAESGGESRLMRFAHGPDELYTRSAWRARELWGELEEELGQELIVRCGVVWFARQEQGWEAEALATMSAQGIPAERLATKDGAPLYPSLSVDDLAWLLYEPAAGVLRAARGTAALAERARRRGARVVRGAARPDGEAVVLDGERMEADLVVWAAGAWLGKLFPGLVELRVTQQDIVFFEAGDEWCAPDVPGYADYDGAGYGCGRLDGHGMKIALDVDGPPIDPDARPERIGPDSERLAREYAALRFPALAEAPLERAKVCHYSMTVDMGFIVAPHPEHDRVWIVGGGSGHGFKHGPAIGEQAVAAMTGAANPEPRFALGPRTAGRSLRTAGWSGSA
jgi:glycine/D-amino acid oxidase-like deaminating enzyme